MTTRYILREYEFLCKNADGAAFGYQCIPENVFDRLEQFVLTYNKTGTADALELMQVTSRRGCGKVIGAKNYVGLIAMADGTHIEILPKIYASKEESSEGQTKKIFLDMLRFIKEIPYKHFNNASVDVDKDSILEIFIQMFINETTSLVKRGLKSDYNTVENNEFYFKGKLNFSQHIKHNAAHKERFYIEYDLFSVDRPENRIIKMTIELLMRISESSRNQKNLYSLSMAFEMVTASTEFEQDWAKVVMDRTIREYQTVLEWCRVFLSGNSFTPFRGEGVAYALLFPMEKVFEQYVAGQLRKKLAHTNFNFKTQDRAYHLFTSPKKFQLKPDIVVQDDQTVVILDTKWKLLSSKPDYGISQADMYQAYAYGKKYGATTVFLLYPFMPGHSEINQSVVYDSGDGVKVQIGFVDLNLGNESVLMLARNLAEMLD